MGCPQKDGGHRISRVLAPVFGLDITMIAGDDQQAALVFPGGEEAAQDGVNPLQVSARLLQRSAMSVPVAGPVLEEAELVPARQHGNAPAGPLQAEQRHVAVAEMLAPAL